MRFAADLRHVRQHVQCASRTKTGAACTAFTNSICVSCGQGVCGRHNNTHHCPTTKATP